MQACQTNSPSAAADALVTGSESSVRALTPAAMTVFSFAGAMLIAASSSAVTPLYHLYQASMHLTPFWITIVFHHIGFLLWGIGVLHAVLAINHAREERRARRIIEATRPQ